MDHQEDGVMDQAVEAVAGLQDHLMVTHMDMLHITPRKHGSLSNPM
jgi:hypothetical protein